MNYEYKNDQDDKIVYESNKIKSSDDNNHHEEELVLVYNDKVNTDSKVYNSTDRHAEELVSVYNDKTNTDGKTYNSRHAEELVSTYNGIGSADSKTYNSRHAEELVSVYNNETNNDGKTYNSRHEEEVVSTYNGIGSADSKMYNSRHEEEVVSTYNGIGSADSKTYKSRHEEEGSTQSKESTASEMHDHTAGSNKKTTKSMQVYAEASEYYALNSATTRSNDFKLKKNDFYGYYMPDQISDNKSANDKELDLATGICKGYMSYNERIKPIKIFEDDDKNQGLKLCNLKDQSIADELTNDDDQKRNEINFMNDSVYENNQGYSDFFAQCDTNKDPSKPFANNDAANVYDNYQSNCGFIDANQRFSINYMANGEEGKQSFGKYYDSPRDEVYSAKREENKNIKHDSYVHLNTNDIHNTIYKPHARSFSTLSDNHKMTKDNIISNGCFKSGIFKSDVFKNNNSKNNAFVNDDANEYIFKNEGFNNDEFENNMFRHDGFKDDGLFKNDLTRNQIHSDNGYKSMNSAGDMKAKYNADSYYNSQSYTQNRKLTMNDAYAVPNLVNSKNVHESIFNSANLHEKNAMLDKTNLYSKFSKSYDMNINGTINNDNLHLHLSSNYEDDKKRDAYKSFNNRGTFCWNAFNRKIDNSALITKNLNDDEISYMNHFDKKGKYVDSLKMQSQINNEDETAKLKKRTRKTKKQPYEYNVTRMYVKGRKIKKAKPAVTKKNDMEYLNMYTNEFPLRSKEANVNCPAFPINGYGFANEQYERYHYDTLEGDAIQENRNWPYYEDQGNGCYNNNTFDREEYSGNSFAPTDFEDQDTGNYYIYSCDPCMKKFKRLSTLKIHIFSHVKEAFIFKCPRNGCESGFKSQSIAIKHINHFHEPEKQNLIESLKRSKYSSIFRSYTTLIDYYTKYYPNTVNPFLGCFCFGCFTYPRSLKDHPCTKMFYALTQCPSCRKEIVYGELESHVGSELCQRSLPIVKNNE